MSGEVSRKLFQFYPREERKVSHLINLLFQCQNIGQPVTNFDKSPIPRLELPHDDLVAESRRLRPTETLEIDEFP